MNQKKLLSLALAALLAMQMLFLTGCDTPQETQQDGASSSEQNDVSGAATGDPTYPPAEEAVDRALGLTFTARSATPTGAMLTFYQEGAALSGTLSTGSWFALEVKVKDDEYTSHWEKVEPIVSPTTIGWDAIRYEIPEQSETRLTMDWSYLYGELPAGGYRIVKILCHTAEDGSIVNSYCYAYFGVEEERFAGYGLRLADVPAEDMPISEPLVQADLRLVAENVTSRGMTLLFRTKDGKEEAEALGGVPYSLERYNGESWEAVPYSPKEDAIFFIMPAIFFRGSDEVSWYYHGDLDPGVYRYIKDFGSWENHADYYAYFEITE